MQIFAFTVQRYKKISLFFSAIIGHCCCYELFNFQSLIGFGIDFIYLKGATFFSETFWAKNCKLQKLKLPTISILGKPVEEESNSVVSNVQRVILQVCYFWKKKLLQLLYLCILQSHQKGGVRNVFFKWVEMVGWRHQGDIPIHCVQIMQITNKLYTIVNISNFNQSLVLCTQRLLVKLTNKTYAILCVLVTVRQSEFYPLNFHRQRECFLSSKCCIFSLQH